MIFSRLIKKVFLTAGLNISRVPPKGKREGNKVTGDSYFQDSLRFLWLKSYGFNTIIDVGANEGQFTRKILYVFPEAEVHCFEPLFGVFQDLKNSLKGKENIFFYHCGLGEANDEKEIFRNEYSPSSSLLEMLDLHKSNFDTAVKVVNERILIRKLDEVLLNKIKRPLLVKIDVQGYEMHVINGGHKIIEQADVVIIETSFYPLYAGQPLFDEIYDYFKSKGFRYAGNVEQLIAPTDHKILQADAVFIKSEG